MLVPAALTMALGLLGSAIQALPGDASAGMAAALAEQSAEMASVIQAERVAYGSGSFGEATAQRLDDFLGMIGFIVIYGFFILGLFLVGAWFARSGAIARPDEHQRLFTRLRWVALPVGLAMVLVSYWLEPTTSFDRLDVRASTAQVLQMLGGAVMALSYLAWLVHGMQAPATARLLGLLGPAGRMALTNYLLQSIVATWIFFGYGLGYFEQLPRAWQPVYVFVFFALQVAVSHWWMARFRFGPAEWAWRAATYLNLPAMRRG
jgi:uncharacterized protein